MNYFDKATNAMIPFHPQTESGAITDWHESIIGSLASKVLPTVVSELTTDSVLGKLMKMLLNASGVKYSIDTNGYVCLGSFFGGLIIQWGASSYGYVKFPIAFTAFRLVLLTHQGSSFMIAKAKEFVDNNGFTLSVTDLNGGVNINQSYDAQYLAIGR